MKQPTSFPLQSRPAAQPLPSSELALTLLGPSPLMSQLWSQIRRLAPYIRCVLLTGEADCGQEAVARLLLDLSPGNRRSFVRLNAAEAELRLARPAALVAFPSDVLIYLPEVDRLSPAAQESLLRLMKMRRARPFTVVAACREDLRGLASVGRFSPELADALAAMQIALPALRERTEDLPMLISHLLCSEAAKAGRAAPAVSEDLLRAAVAHRWPGNLAELTHTLGSLCLEPGPGPLGAAELGRALASHRPERVAEPAPVRMVPVDTIVREHIVAVLRACRGNKLRAAEVLGISRSTLYRTLESTGGGEPGALPLAS